MRMFTAQYVPPQKVNITNIKTLLLVDWNFRCCHCACMGPDKHTFPLFFERL